MLSVALKSKNSKRSNKPATSAVPWGSNAVTGCPVELVFPGGPEGPGLAPHCEAGGRCRPTGASFWNVE